MSGYVSDLIKDDYKKWESGNAIIINSHTGSGKTFFIFNELLKFAMEQDKIILYFCNRKSIKHQLLSKYLDKTFSIDNKKRGIWDSIYVLTYQYCEISKQFPDFNNVDISKFIPEELQLFKKTNAKNTSSTLTNMDKVLYYIFDEAHYFVSDSSFNSGTAFWNKKKLMPKNKISIFLTATPDPLFCMLYLQRGTVDIEFFLKNFYLNKNEEIKIHRDIKNTKENIEEIESLGLIGDATKEKLNEEKEKLHTLSKEILKKKAFRSVVALVSEMLDSFSQGKQLKENIIMYSQEKTYDNYDCFYFQEFDELLELISHSKDKWIIFIDNEAKGKELESKINRLYGNGSNAVFISANTIKIKSSLARNEYDNLINKEAFSCKVLIATSVIDCGINIIDSHLKNIVLSQPNKTIFFQMMGRCRINENQNINLYLKSFEPRTINAFSCAAIDNVNLAIDFINFCKAKNPKDSDRNNLLKRISNQSQSKIIVVSEYTSRNTYKDSTIVNIENIYKINYLNLIYNFYSIYLYYETLLKNKETLNTQIFYLIEQLSWLDKKYDITKWVGYADKREKIIEFLQKYVNNNGIDAKEKNNFRKELLNKILLFPHCILPKQVQQNISRYKNGTAAIPQINKLNDALNQLKIPYCIEKKSKYSDKWIVKAKKITEL